jgi:hypothetical protein
LAALVPSAGTISIWKSIFVYIAGTAGTRVLHIRTLSAARVLNLEEK